MEHYDARETRDRALRAADLASRLPVQLAHAQASTSHYGRTLSDIDLEAVTDRASLANLPLTRKADIAASQRDDPPFGGLVATPVGKLSKLFASPGPIYEPEADRRDYWRFARAIHAAGIRAGDTVLNCFSYHLTPAGSMMEGALRAIGCPVIPGGPGNSELQARMIQDLRPVGYIGTPDFLKILLDTSETLDLDSSSIVRASVGGAALPPSLRADLNERGVFVLQAYGTADVGLIAYETACEGTPLPGMVVDEDVIVEIVRPGTRNPVPDGEVGEVVVTTFNQDHPLVRLATGDLSMILSEPSPCGRTNTRINGWMGRADQTAKVRGMFLRPEQIEEIASRFPEVSRLRAVIERSDEQDHLTLRAESSVRTSDLSERLAQVLRDVTKLRGDVTLVEELPNDGKVIEDARPIG